MYRCIFLLIVPILFANAQQNKTDENRPNILWITSEDNSADWLSCYGNPYSETPNIDQLAKNGFQYMHCYANAPVCAPTRSTWITGVNAVSMGTHNMRSYYKVPKEIEFYTTHLRANGYYLGNFKKQDYNIADTSESMWNSLEKPDWNTLKNSQPFFQVVNIGSSHESGAFGDVYNTEHDPAKTKLRKYHPDVPGMRENYAHYHDAIKKMDSEVGRNINKIKELGLAENTIIIYTSDHGGVLPRSKRFLFANSLHCPMVIQIPEQYNDLWPAAHKGSKIDRLVSFVDMPKTWLSITNSEVPKVMQGTVFLGKDTETEQEYHFSYRGRADERVENARAISDKRYLYIRNYMPYVPWMQRLEYLWRITATQVWEKAVKEGKANEMQSRFFYPKNWTEELYDMQNDFDCLNNLIDNPELKSTADRLRTALRKKQIEIFDTGLLPEKEMVQYAADNNTTVNELARNPKLYNVASILDAADIALSKTPANIPKLKKLINSENVALRYWGMVGFFLLNNNEAAQQCINDKAHSIRQMAAWTLINTGDKAQGINSLVEMIESDSYDMLTLFNMGDWLGEDGKALVPAINNVQINKKGGAYSKYLVRMKEYLETL